MWITVAKRSAGYLLLLASVAIVVTWWVRNDMAIRHDETMRYWTQNEQFGGPPHFYDPDAYPEPSVAWYGLAALAAGIGGVVVLERSAYKRGEARPEPERADALL